jgi:hypothetical protein
LARYVQTNQQVATAFSVSHTYIDIARKLIPGKREAILRGWDSTSFAELLPVPHCASVTDKHLETVIRIAGIERVLEAACAVEHN